MYLGAVYLLFELYSVGCCVLFTCLLLFGYNHMDILTLPVYCISSISTFSYCHPIGCAWLPVASEAHQVDRKVSRSRSSLCSGIQVMEIWMKIFLQWNKHSEKLINVIIQREQSYEGLSVHLVRFTLWKSVSVSSSSRNKVTDIWMHVFIQQEHSYRDLSIRRAAFR
jgi:hypothetical protein